MPKMPRFVATSPIPTSHAGIGNSTFANDGDHTRGSVSGPEDFTTNLMQYMTGAKLPSPDSKKSLSRASSFISHATDDPPDDESSRIEGPTEFTKYMESYVGEVAKPESQPAPVPAPVPAPAPPVQRQRSLQATVSDEEEEREHEVSRIIDGIFGGPEPEPLPPTEQLPTSADDTLPLPEHRSKRNGNGHTQSAPKKAPSPVHLNSAKSDAQKEHMQKQISELQSQLRDAKNENKELRIQKLQKQYASQAFEELKFDHSEEVVQDLREQLTQHESQFIKLEEILEDRARAIHDLLREIQTKDATIKTLEERNAKRTEKQNATTQDKDQKFKATLDEERARHSAELQDRNQRIMEHQSRIQVLETELNLKDQTIQRLDENQLRRDKEIEILLKHLDGALQDGRAHYSEKLESHNQQVVRNESRIRDLETQLLTKDKTTRIILKRFDRAFENGRPRYSPEPESQLKQIEARVHDLETELRLKKDNNVRAQREHNQEADELRDQLGASRARVEVLEASTADLRSKVAKLGAEKKMVEGALMMEWAKQECPGERDSIGRQAYKYKYAKKN